MPPAGPRLLLAVALLLQSVTYVTSSPVLDSSQRPLDAIPQTGSFITPVHPEKNKRKLNGKFLHMTDFHPDEFYKVHSSTRGGLACHRGKGAAGAYGAETTDCDSPMSLVNATLDWIRANLKDEIDFVVWTGDTARHDSDEKHPRSTSNVLETNKAVAKKVVETFSDHGQLSIPVVPNLGNNDFLPHNIFYPGPNKWLQYYSEIWHRFIPEEQRHSFGFGGWFEVEVVPNKLSVFSLNTMYFFDRNAGVDGCASPSEPGFKHLEWLSVQLQRLRERGMKAILIGHVPPARTESKQLWDEACWQKYTLWLKQFRDVVTGSLYGHMNIDHFLLQDTKDIDIALNAQDAPLRTSLENEFSIQSKSEYLQELRKYWSRLPSSVAKTLEEDEEDEQFDIQDDDVDEFGKKRKKKDGKKHKKKKKKDLDKIGGKYGERYQLTFVSPSVVPNYLPTIRVIEYNITGLEDIPVWADSLKSRDTEASGADDVDYQESEIDQDEEPRLELKRDLEAERRRKRKGKKSRKGRKDRKGRKGKKKPKDPQLVIPQDPPKESLPGPAYFPQPLTFTGYTQYFANLTWINNDMTDMADGKRWRDGDFSDQDPNHDKARPRKFKYEVEYSTFTDKIFNLPDLTVRNYLKLAYRIGQRQEKKNNRRGKGKGKGKGKSIEEADDDFELDLEDDQDIPEPWSKQDSIETSDEFISEQELEVLDSEDDSEQDSESEQEDTQEDSLEDPEADTTTKGKKHKGKGKKGGNRKKQNKVWRHFLREAFVNTIPEKQLKKLARR